MATNASGWRGFGIRHSWHVCAISTIFANVGPNWAADNMEAALAIFTEGHIPNDAFQHLGFPLDMVIPLPHMEPGVGGDYTGNGNNNDDNNNDDSGDGHNNGE